MIVYVLGINLNEDRNMVKRKVSDYTEKWVGDTIIGAQNPF